MNECKVCAGHREALGDDYERLIQLVPDLPALEGMLGATRDVLVPDTIESEARLRAEVERLTAQLAERDRRVEELEHLGRNFYAMVRGECPSLLEDDHNAYKFEFALAMKEPE